MNCMRSLHWLIITERIEYKLLSLTVPTKFSQLPNLLTFITSSLSNVLFIRRYSCSATDNILSKSNWSLLSLYFIWFPESTPFIFHQPHSVPVPPFPTYLFLHPSLLPLLIHHSAHLWLPFSFTPGLYLFQKSFSPQFHFFFRTAFMDYCLDRFFWDTRFLFSVFLLFCFCSVR